MTEAGGTREWHAWSVWKTEILLGSYLPAFASASRGARHRVFIDCFAGATRNVQVGTGREFPGSPRLALSVQPPFTHLLLFELPDKAIALERALRAEWPDRAIRVIGEDCNAAIAQGLQWIRSQGTTSAGPHLGPTLAYLDPDALELEWRTIEHLARWAMTREGNAYKRRNRIELLVLFPTGPMRRQLPQPPRPDATEVSKQDIDRLFGGTEWRAIYKAQRDGLIGGEDSWIRYVELYRLKLQSLGYGYTAAVEVRNTSQVVLYHMIFATGNATGERIMKTVFTKARQILPQMVAAERDARRSSGARLFEESDFELDQIASDPTRWAALYDAPPRAFDPNEHLVATPIDVHEPEQLGFDLRMPDP